MFVVTAKVDASPLATSADEIKKAVEEAIKKEVPCQLYDLKVEVTEEP